MTPLPLFLEKDHLFTEIDGDRWLIDTGAPSSFGTAARIELDGQEFEISPSFMGLDHTKLAEFVGAPCCGLLGTDVLNAFDVLFDLPGGCLTLSRDELDRLGTTVPLDSFEGIPIVEADCAGRRFRLFFDTGAQISYLQDELVAGFPSAGSVRDFYPGFGQFDTETHQVDCVIAGLLLTDRFGQLPGLLGMSLTLADVQGILGNRFMKDRVVGYFPRRKLLIL